MERKLTLADQVQNLELANMALRNYVQELQGKLAKYEHIMQCCPRFRMEKAAEMQSSGVQWIESHPGEAYEDFYDDLDEEEDDYSDLADLEEDEDDYSDLADLEDE